MIWEALCVSLVVYLCSILSDFLASDSVSRPIVIAPLVGLLLGDLQTGIIMGAALEGIYMGYSAIGGTVPGDATAGSALAVAFAILTGSNMETALALSVPIASAMGAAIGLVLAISSMLAPKYDALLKNRQYKTFVTMHVLQPFVLMRAPTTIILFVSVAFGIGQVEKLLAMLPASVMQGLNVAGGMLPAVGFAILLNMTFTKEIGIFFFVGFVFAKYMNLPIIAITILAVAIAWVVFGSTKEAAPSMAAVTAQSAAEEDFFNE